MFLRHYNSDWQRRHQRSFDQCNGFSLVKPGRFGSNFEWSFKNLANPVRALVLISICTLSLVDPEQLLLRQLRSRRSIGHVSWIGSSDRRLGLSGKNLYVARRL
jgi:hypothetical protein